MAVTSSSNASATLRAITYRITTAAPEQLPLLATQVSGLIWNCREILSASADSLGSKSETTALIHRFRTKITSLLQDRTIEGRWAAVVLTKAAIEAGGVEFLSKSNAWVRSLLATLKRPDPSTTKCLAAITLTRIFTSTWDYSNLVREITTPALPGFISTCLSNAKKERCSANELDTILAAFATLLPKHPTIFRTHESQITAVLNDVLSSGSLSHHSQKTKAIAQRVRVLLHHCAPKQGGSEQWDKTLQATIAAVHTTCDRLFRSTSEDWSSVAGVRIQAADANIFAPAEAELEREDELSLKPWHGVLGGRNRLVTLIELLQSHLETATSSPVPLRIGSLVDAIARLLSLTAPSCMNAATANSQVSKDEREILAAMLPSIHVSAMELIFALLNRFGNASASFAPSLMELILDVYRAESFDDRLREASCRCLELLLQLFGPSLPKENVTELNVLVRGCCEVLMPVNTPGTATNGSISSVQATNGLSAEAAKPNGIKPGSEHAGLTMAASRLLSTIVTKLQPSYISRKLRTQIERTAVLTRNKNTLLACVMNPGQKDMGAKLQTSLLPLLAREFPNAPEVEALLRPRMPPVVLQRLADGGEEAEEDDEDMNGPNGEPTNGDLQQQDGAVSNDDDPTSDLFKALTQPSNPASDHEEQDELYSATPPPNFQVPTKRAADFTAIDTENSTKRLRASPTEEPATVQVGVPVTIAVAQGEDEYVESTILVAPQIKATDGVGDGGDAGSDYSDFEMPPLTMEPDTDPEDEGEDEGEGEDE